ncbi:conserved hypothetical protein [Culex quinquefasciatus]|uniref:Delta-like protein n=1 Tax=Culex quinquefasciatus TaxID=7176 RepID=B0XIW8_CULQU|nr:conserved hypothetical protein [Culex quinquefasciatus]|eukprot:XP_001869590.1 conserved hypothetical protein [Culex quinquefasciatus]
MFVSTAAATTDEQCRVLDVSPDWTEDSYNSSHTTIQYAFRVTCDSSYYGPGCANLCRKRDDQFGHYTCSPNGERVCLTGWQGDYCTTRKYLLSFADLIITTQQSSISIGKLQTARFK